MDVKNIGLVIMKHRRQNDKTPNDGMDSYVYMLSDRHFEGYEEYYLAENGVYPERDERSGFNPDAKLKQFKDLCERCERHLFTKKTQLGYLCERCENYIVKWENLKMLARQIKWPKEAFKK